MDIYQKELELRNCPLHYFQSITVIMKSFSKVWKELLFNKIQLSGGC